MSASAVRLVDVENQQVLHVCRAQFAAREAIGEVGRGTHLLGRDATPQHRGAHVDIAFLFLRVNAYVIPVHIVRGFFRYRRVEISP